MDLRTKYDDRLEKLREHENSKYDITSMVTSVMTSPNVTEIQSSSNVKRPSMSRVTFEEDPQLLKGSEIVQEIFEKPPTSMTRVPYWQMRALKMSVQNGSFLTPTLFVPKIVWSQSKAKVYSLQAFNFVTSH